MQKIIQIHQCLLKLSRKQESVTDGGTHGRTDGRYYYIPSPLSRGITTWKGRYIFGNGNKICKI